MRSDHDFVSKAKGIATFLYNDVPEITPIASNNNQVFRLNFGDSRAIKVLKIGQHSADGLRREQQVMTALHARGFAVPAIEFTQEDADFGVDFTAMPFIAGVSIDQVSGLGPSAAGNAYENLGHFMCRLIWLDASSIFGARVIEEIKRNAEIAWAESYALLLKHRRCNVRLVEIFEHGRDIRDGPEGFWCLTHGDSLQLLTDGEDVFSVIDWEAASAGHALGELGYFLLAHEFGHYSKSKRECRSPQSGAHGFLKGLWARLN